MVVLVRLRGTPRFLGLGDDHHLPDPHRLLAWLLHGDDGGGRHLDRYSPSPYQGALAQGDDADWCGDGAQIGKVTHDIFGGADGDRIDRSSVFRPWNPAGMNGNNLTEEEMLQDDIRIRVNIDSTGLECDELIEFVTFNCTCGAGLFNFLNGPAGCITNKVINNVGEQVATMMVAILVQEHHYCTDEQLDEASSRASSLGWSSFWSPAQYLPSGMPSGGTAVLVHKALGARPCDRLVRADVPIHLRHRVAAATVSFGEAHGEVDLFSVYLLDGVGLSPANLELLSMVADMLPQRQCLIGGDFQVKPAILAKSAVIEHMGMEVLAAPLSEPTIRSNLGNYSTIDFFLASGGVAAVIDKVSVKVDVDFRPHRPVGAYLPRHFVEAWFRTWWLPPALPRVAVHGPRPFHPSATYDTISRRADDLLRAAQSESDACVQWELGRLYRLWAEEAEQELCGITGVASWGSSRGRVPRLVWRRLLDLPRRPPSPTRSVAHRARMIYHNGELVLKSVLNNDLRAAELAWSTVTTTADHWTEADDEFAIPLHTFLNVLGFLVAESCSAVERLGWGDFENESWIEARGEVELSLDEWASLARRAEARQKDEDRKAIRQWAATSLEKGARKAHRVGRQVGRWMASTVDDPSTEDGKTACPLRVLASAAAKWAKVWRTSPQTTSRPRPFLPECIPNRGFEGQEVPPIPGVEQIRAASLTFPVSTAIQVDGFHPRHFSLLGDCALHSLGALFAIVDCTGILPPQVAQITMPMLPKKSGGHRLIGLYAGFYRLWARIWVPVVGAWERGWCDLPWMAACRNRCPTDVVFRSEIRAQGAVSQGSVAGCLSCDIASFYEVISHDILATRARELGFPLAPLRGAIRGYRMARYLVGSGAVAQPLCSFVGIVAGDSFATTLVKCFYRSPFESMLASWRAVGWAGSEPQLDVYIDDITVGSAASSPSGLVADLALAFKDVKAVVEQDLGATIHPQKTQVISSSLAATERLMKLCVGRMSARRLDSYCLLGVDLKQGARWRSRHGTPTTRVSRMQAAGRRHRRLAIFRRLAGSRAACLFKSGVQSVGGYGVEVTGLSDTCLHRLRSWACAYMCPTRASRTAVFALDGDPTTTLSVAVACRWAREVWSSGWDLRALSIPHLSTIFHEGLEARSVTRWSSCKGPVSAVALELARAGWEWPSAFMYRNDLGEDIHLTQVSPGLLREMFVASRGRQLCRALAARSGAAPVPPPFSGSPHQNPGPDRDAFCSFTAVDPSPVQHVLRSRRLDSRQKGALRRAFQSAIFTLDRMKECGYEVPDTRCPMCRSTSDSVHHRIFECTHPDVASIRADLFSGAMLAEASRLNPIVSINGWSSASYPCPAPAVGDLLAHATVQRAVEQQEAEYRYVWESCDWTDARDEIRQQAGRMMCFTDGSMFKDEWRSSWRAGWGIYVDIDGQPAFRFLGPVCGSFQTVPVAEWTAISVAASFWPPSAHPPWSDCLGVVRAFDDLGAFVKKGGVLAGLARRVLAIATPFGGPFKLLKVKAHQHLRWDMGSTELRAAAGNDQADAAAKFGARFHPSPSPAERAGFMHWWSRSLLCAEVVGKILALFPTVLEQYGKLSRVSSRGGSGRRSGTAAKPLVPLESRHDFKQVGGSIVCLRCLVRVFSWRKAHDRTLHSLCPGLCQNLADVWLADRRGHSLQLISHAGAATIVCVRCGGFCSTHFSAILTSQCRGAAGASVRRRGALSRLRRGLHPDFRKDIFF